MIWCTLREPRGKVPTTGIETWDLDESLSDDMVESVLASSGMLELPLGAGGVALPVYFRGEDSSSPVAADWVALFSS